MEEFAPKVFTNGKSYKYVVAQNATCYSDVCNTCHLFDECKENEKCGMDSFCMAMCGFSTTKHFELFEHKF